MIKDELQRARHRETFEMLRLLRGLSHSEAARKTGVPASTIARWRWPVNQGGVKLPRYDTMSRVLAAFGYHFTKTPIDPRQNERWEDTVGPWRGTRGLEIVKKAKRRKKRKGG